MKALFLAVFVLSAAYAADRVVLFEEYTSTG